MKKVLIFNKNQKFVNDQIEKKTMDKNTTFCQKFMSAINTFLTNQ